MFFVSILLNRTFQIGNREYVPSFENAFSFNKIDWRRKKDPEWLIEPLKEGASPRNYNDTIISSNKFYGVNLIEHKKLQEKLVTSNLLDIIGGSNVQTVMMSNNKGRIIKLYDNPFYKTQISNMNISKYDLFHCFVSYLFKPKSEIFIPILNEFNAMTTIDDSILKIGIQIRVGDWYWNNPHQSVDLLVIILNYIP